MTRIAWIFGALCAHLGATSIAVIVTPKFVAVAADSRAVNLQGSRQEDVCKIRRAGDVFYIPNKFVADKASGYDLDRVVLNARGSTSVVELAEKVKSTIIVPLLAALEHTRSTDRAMFNDIFASGQAMGVAFVGFENHAPVVINLQVMIEDLNAPNLRLRVEENRCPGPDCPVGYALVVVPGNLKSRFEAAHPRYWIGSAETVAANAEAFIALAIGEKRVDIGPPVSLLIVDSPQGRWLKPGVCIQ